jgi:hypothetical protein
MPGNSRLKKRNTRPCSVACRTKENAQQAVLQKKLDGIGVKSYSGIWKDTVTTADWEAKAGSIQAKKDYFAYRLKEGSLSDADTAKFAQFIKDLDEFDTESRAYGEVCGELKKVKNLLTGLKNSK